MSKQQAECWLVIDKHGPWPGCVQYVTDRQPETLEDPLICTGPFPLQVKPGCGGDCKCGEKEEPKLVAIKAKAPLALLDACPDCGRSPVETTGGMKHICTDRVIFFDSATAWKSHVAKGTRPKEKSGISYCPICNTKARPSGIGEELIGHVHHSGGMVSSTFCNKQEWNDKCKQLILEKLPSCPCCGTKPVRREDGTLIHNHDVSAGIHYELHFSSIKQWENYCKGKL